MAKTASKGEKLGRPLSFRISEADYALFSEKVKASGCSSSEFFRNCVLNNQTTILARTHVEQDFLRTLYILNKVDVSLASVVRRVEAMYASGDIALSLCESFLNEIEGLNEAVSKEIIYAHSN